jgi:hypothetical protein
MRATGLHPPFPKRLMKQTDRTFQVDCVPEDDCSHYQVASAGSVTLIFECPITQFTEAVKEYSTGQGVLGFSFVQTDLNPAAQIGTLQPFKGKEGPFDTSDFAQCSRRAILAGIGTQFSQNERRRYSSLTDRSSQPKHFLPLSSNEFAVYRAADQPSQC